MYDTLQEVTQKVVKTVGLYNSVPRYINNAAVDPVNAERFLLASFECCPEEKTVEHIDARAQGWDFQNLGCRLGYMNIEYNGYKQAVWTRRVPVRKAQQTQGLSHNNVKCERVKANPMIGLPGTFLHFDTLRRLKGFRDTVDGKFPTLNAVTQKLSDEDDLVSQAFSRTLAVTKSPLGLFYLLYKGGPIGWTEDFNTFRVHKQFRYLDELLIEDNHLKVQ